MYINKSKLGIWGSAVVLLLSACGGGGGGGGSGFQAPAISNTPVAITADNESEIAQAGVDAATGGAAVGSYVPFSPLTLNSKNESA